MAEARFYKYEEGNYFEGLNFIDKLYINRLPVNGFPVFDISTEAIGNILVRKAGEFDVTVIIDSGETSIYNNLSINDFFRGDDVNYKYLVGIMFSDTQTFWGTFTTEQIDFYYGSRKFNFKAKHIQTELENAFNNSMLGTLDHDRTFDDYLLNALYPPNIDTGLIQTRKSFTSYGTLIGNTNVQMRYLLQNSGDWIANIGSWQAFLELMLGTGLMFKVNFIGLAGVNEPRFELYIFTLDTLTNNATPLIIGDPQETYIFNPKKWIFIPYKKVNNSAVLHFSGSIPDYVVYSIIDGVSYNGIDAPHSADEIRPLPNAVLKYPMWGGSYAHTDIKAGYTYINPDYQTISETVNEDNNAIFINLPLYKYHYNFEGVFPPGPAIDPASLNRQMVYASILRDGIWNNNEVQVYAVKQYKRYIAGLNRTLKLQAVWDSSHIYDVFEKLSLQKDGETKDFYINRIENIDLFSRTCSLTLVQL